MHISGLLTSKTLEQIEFELEEIYKPVPEVEKPELPAQPAQQIVQEAVPPPPEIVKPTPLPAPEPEPQEAPAPSLVEEVKVPAAPPQPVRPAPVTAASSPSKPSPGANYATPNAYWAMVSRRIEQHKEYPQMARLRNWEGRVTLQFVITLEGDVREAKVIKGSGFRALDSAAVEALRRAAPFPKPPRNLFSSDVPFMVTLCYDLT